MVALAFAGLLGCGASGGGGGGGADDAGANGSGGAPGSGGTTTTSSGGAPGSGGVAAASGGAPGSGGMLGSGGMTSSSGGASSGGAVGSGGKAAGGAIGSGGVSAPGGHATGGSAAGGRSSSGGVTGGGGGGGGNSGGAPATGGHGGAASGGAGGGFVNCPMTGHVTYTLTKASQPTADETAAYAKITPAMDLAVMYYNCYTGITKADTVTYVPSVATADGNVNGSIRFGSTDTMNYITAMHEISHTVGIGSTQFDALVVSGIFTGTNATAQLRAITGNAADEVHADTQHFWPNGLNYTTEVTSVPSDLINHCMMVTAIRKDMGM
jgi:hypothetical protein